MADPRPDVFLPSWNPQDQGEVNPGTAQRPSFEGTYVDPAEPETAGAPEAFSSLYAPEFYRGLIDAATFLVDIPTMGAGYILGEGAEALGFDETAKKLKDPVLLSDIAKQGFEAPARIEEAITGEAPTVTAGFDATPREARNSRERFFRDLAYISGGGLSFPTSLGAFYGTLRAPTQKLLSDAMGRGANSEAARKAINSAVNTKSPNALRALNEAARQYSARFTSGLGTRAGRTIAGEQTLATAAGLGYAAPELFTDDDGKILMDIGEGEVDVAPTLKILSSMGLPIALAHTPSGIVIAGDKTKVVPLMRYVRDRAQVFAKSLLGGFTESGRMDMAARIFNQMESEPGVLENVLLPAIEAGQFRSPGSSTPIKILEDGTVAPEYGGINPDTLQALKILGYDDTRLSMLDEALRGRGTNLQGRLEEEARRAKRLDDSFELLRSHLGSGDEAAAYRAIEKARNNLDDEALDAVEAAVARARDVFEALEPSVGRAEASKAAVDMLEAARLESREITKKLFDKELIGTDTVDTRKFGDWAISVIREVGERNLPVMQGMGDFYKLAGKKRLQEAGLLPSGKPITDADLGGVRGTGDEALKADEIPDQGLYDIFGDAGTIYAEPVRIETVQNFRSEIGDKARAAYKAGNPKLGKRLSLIIDYIDDEILVAKNFEGRVAPENIRNIEVGRQYVLDAKSRFGPNSEIGKLLFKGDDILDEGFLNRLIKAGPEAGARVELFRNALNEPQQVVQGSDVTWQRDPAASLTVGDNPNVIEAELLLRYTESLAGGAVTQKNVDRFVTRYGEAIDKIPGLREKFNDLKAVQAAADAMTSKLTVPDRDRVLAAIREGATLDDIANARRVLRENLEDRQLANTASEYLNADVNQAASTFINADPKNAARRADEIDALLAKDETGQAARGFRAALWRSLRESSLRFDPDGEILPGIDPKKLAETVERNRPYLEKFYDKSSMEFLDELVKGGSLQTTGTGAPTAGSPRNVMRAEFGTVETVGAIGRTAGQKIFGTIGINPLVATGMGRRIAAYTFTQLGEEAIMKNVEDALRDPEKAAVLIRRYKNLDKFEPPEKVKKVAEEVVEDPGKLAGDTARGAFSTAKDRLSRAAAFVSKYLKGHSQEAIERAVRFGLIPAQGETRRRSLDEDYRMGPPFRFEDNRIRYEIENAPPEEDEAGGDQSSVAPVAPPTRQVASAMPAPRAPAAASTLSQVSPVASRPMGQPSQQTLSGLNQLGLPLFAAKEGGYISRKPSGIMSIKKNRQIVG